MLPAPSGPVVNGCAQRLTTWLPLVVSGRLVLFPLAVFATNRRSVEMVW